MTELAPAPAPTLSTPEGAKCGLDAIDPPMAAMWAPYAGATSFDEADEYERAQESAQAVGRLTMAFSGIVGNILSDGDLNLSQKADAVVAAANDLKTRLQADPDVQGVDDEGPGMGEGSAAAGETFWARIGFKKKMGTVGGVKIDRDKIPAEDFAGPNRSFPITNGASVAAAAQSLGRAKGDTDPIKAKIISIAKRKGLTDSLPDAWKPGKKDGTTTSTVGETVWNFDLSEHVAPGTLHAVKDRNGDYRWTAIYSNKFEDRDGEIFPYARHKEFESWVEQTKAYPELRLWHVPGSRLGEADMVALDSGGFMLATGTFDEGRKDAAERLAAMGPLAVSHGYFYDSKSPDGVFGAYRTFEISPLPLGREANELGGFSVSEDTKMLKPAQKEFLIGVLGPDETTKLETQLTALGAAARAKGLNFKEVAPTLGEAFAEAVSAGFKDEEPPPAPAPVAAAGLTPEALAAALGPVLAPITARLDQLAADQATIQTAVKELATDEDTRLASMFKPRIGAVVPSQGAGTKEGTAADGSLEKQAQEGMKEDGDNVPAHLAAHMRLMQAAAGAASAAAS